MAEKKENETLEEVKKIIEEAKAEAKRIIEEAKAVTKGEMSEEVRAQRKKDEEYMNELVEVQLHKDNHRYKDDVFVAVNGENCVIKRGEKVKIKRKFALILEQSMKQDYETSVLIENAATPKKVADM